MVALLGTTKNGRQRLLSCNEPVSRSETELGNCASGSSLLAETPAGIMTTNSETANSTTSMAVGGVPFVTTSGEASLDEAPRNPHLVPKPPSQFVWGSESVFGDEESCLPVRVVSDATQGGKERAAGRKRDLNKLDSIGPSTPTYKKRNSLSKQTLTSAHGGVFPSPMVSGVPRTPLRINHSGMAALEMPSPSSSVLSTPTRSQGEGLVDGASPSPAAAKG